MVYLEGDEEETKKKLNEEVVKDKVVWNNPKNNVNATVISNVIGSALRSGRLSILKASPSFPVNVERKSFH